MKAHRLTPRLRSSLSSPGRTLKDYKLMCYVREAAAGEGTKDVAKSLGAGHIVAKVGKKRRTPGGSNTRVYREAEGS